MTNSPFNKILGNEHAKIDLKNALSTRNIPHSWLLSGPKGIGKSSLVYLFIQQLFLDIPGAFERIANKTFTDFIEITNDKNKDITASDIREITKFLSLTAGESKYRVVLIDGAEYMNKFAANALLKILEEPPANALIFLISHNPSLLLPTIKSRCRHVKMYPLSNQECKSILGNEVSNEILKIANGSPGVAYELMQVNAVELYQEFISITADNNTEKLYKIADNIDHSEGYSWKLVSIIIANLLLNIIKQAAMTEETNEQQIAKIAKNYNIDQWFKVADKITKMLFETNLLNFDKRHILITTFNLLSKGV